MKNKLIFYSLFFNLVYTLLLLIGINILLVSCSSLKNNESNVLLGKTSWETWKQKAGWMIYDAPDFTTDSAAIALIRQKSKTAGITFTVFGTTTCEDCKENLPKLFKVFAQAAIDSSRITLIGLDEFNTEPTGMYKNFDIDYTPCLFVLRNDKVIGRIGYPKYNWVDGIIKILEEL